MSLADFIRGSSHLKVFAIEVASLSPDTSQLSDFVKVISSETPQVFLDRSSAHMRDKWNDGTFAIAVNTLYKTLKTSMPTPTPDEHRLLEDIDNIKRNLLKAVRTKVRLANTIVDLPPREDPKKKIDDVDEDWKVDKEIFREKRIDDENSSDEELTEDEDSDAEEQESTLYSDSSSLTISQKPLQDPQDNNTLLSSLMNQLIVRETQMNIRENQLNQRENRLNSREDQLYKI
jgi:hypothetical protein